MAQTPYQRMERQFRPCADTHWSILSRFNNLLIILNISLFFLTDLVTKQGYYYTYYSLLFLAVVALATLLPIGLFNRLWYYSFCLLCECAGVYFLVVSAWYWINTSVG